MKSVILVLALLLVFLMAPGNDAMSYDRPHREVPNAGYSGGDDHPWGGDNRVDGGGVITGETGLQGGFGILVLDQIISIYIVREHYGLVSRDIRSRHTTQVSRPAGTGIVRAGETDNSQNESGRVIR